jgi:pSer/pThr/pTyr-binding forkhead associated (FHA) protein
MWKLVIEDEEGQRTVVPLTRDEYTFGRREGNTIRLTERNVSRDHGRLFRRHPEEVSVSLAPGATARTPDVARDTFVIEDRTSYNGLFVNGIRIGSAQELSHGDLIQVGDYRVVLQDDTASSVDTAPVPASRTEPGFDIKVTAPMSIGARGQGLTQRPSRFVMLVGPTPGVEYPLDRERLTIGRAEDASISVNHNSVSRLHCEVQALGDGRYEIVDKGSSNGVRVNAVELKRSIIEAGDVVELGDVRFKFVGAGQVFVPGPNESQQLTAISDRDAELADRSRRPLSGYVLPILGAGVFGAFIILAFVYVLRLRANANGGATAEPLRVVPGDSDHALLAEATKTCTVDECDVAYAQVSALPDGSPWRDSVEFRQIESFWAESVMKKARVEADPSRKRILLTAVSTARTLDEGHRKQLAMELATLDQTAATPSQLPAAPSSLPVAPREAAAPTTAAAARSAVPAHATPTVATVPGVAPPRVPAQSAVDKARQAVLEGREQDVRNLLEARVRSGKGSIEEVRLFRAFCRQVHDQACVDELRAKYPANP